MHQTCLTKYLKSITHRDISDISEGVKCPHCRTLITQEHCACKFITFLNAIDYGIQEQQSHEPHMCVDCSLVISTNIIDACTCHIINCKCKGIIAPQVELVD